MIHPKRSRYAIFTATGFYGHSYIDFTHSSKIPDKLLNNATQTMCERALPCRFIQLNVLNVCMARFSLPTIQSSSRNIIKTSKIGMVFRFCTRRSPDLNLEITLNRCGPLATWMPPSIYHLPSYLPQRRIKVSGLIYLLGTNYRESNGFPRFYPALRTAQGRPV